MYDGKEHSKNVITAIKPYGGNDPALVSDHEISARGNAGDYAVITFVRFDGDEVAGIANTVTPVIRSGDGTDKTGNYEFFYEYGTLTVEKAVYDMSRVTANGYFDSADTPEDRDKLKSTLAVQRTEDFRNGTPKLGGGVPDVLPEDAPEFLRDYFDYYKTPRGYHPRSLNSNGGRNATFTDSVDKLPAD